MRRSAEDMAAFSGGHAFFGPTVEGVVHQNARETMAAQPEFAGASAASLPKRIYRDRLTVGSGGEQIHV